MRVFQKIDGIVLIARVYIMSRYSVYRLASDVDVVLGIVWFAVMYVDLVLW